MTEQYYGTKLIEAWPQEDENGDEGYADMLANDWQVVE